ncbi:cation:proton antiporter [Paracoccus sp. MKU1]|uniref:cation:proton antiporter n=1 Tax=Paracoccus sp. MKU1 TaxID=1745182 RepID=UPI0007192AEF|nr:cation:proton antiporter [Paracoccus sp. MKU1]KRW94424.1 sodium:proton exchanger [Paracoccus sp. MKU1]
MHADQGLLEAAALLAMMAFCHVAICARLGIPALVGFLLSGIVIGPSGLGLIAEGATLTLIGEVGVILLLFALGLEFSLDKLVSLRRLIFGLGLAQVLVTGGLVTVGLLVFTEIAPAAAVLIAGAVAMSSTALCLKVLAGGDALGTPQGRVAIAVLLFQDLAAVGFLAFHDVIAAAGVVESAHDVLKMVGGMGMLVAALFIARSTLQRLAGWVATQGEAELAQLLALTVALLAAIIAQAAGLSPALGAFAAGMMIAEGDARQFVEREIRPFRDLFVGVFFIGIGAQLHIDAVWSTWPRVLAWLFVLMVVKLALVVALTRMFGEQLETALRAGAILAHGGEFSLMLISVTTASGLLQAKIADPLFLALGLSMLIGAVVVRRAA